jgi:DNA-binding NarL/FixJ family response regulator
VTISKKLSPKEFAIMVRLVERGESTTEVAKALGLTTSTVYTHVWRACMKLDARSRMQAAGIFAVMRQKDLSHPPER